MKQAFRQYGSVAAVLAVIAALSVLLTLLTGGLVPRGRRDDRPMVLATTYPIYVAAQQILGDDTSVVLTRLDGSASGCLHDYQLSPSDRRAVQEADLILLNGAGAESFLDGIVDADKCVDTSAKAELLLLDGAHHHDHEGEEHPHEEYNEHLWLSPDRYVTQVAAVRDALCALNPAMEDVYYTNAYDYALAIYDLQVQLESLKESLSGTPCVLFHDSMAYLAAELGLDVKLTLSVEGESGLSAADLKQVEALAAENPDLLLFYDTQYALRYEGVAGTAVSIHTAVQGEDWLTAMKHNIENIRKVLGVSV